MIERLKPLEFLGILKRINLKNSDIETYIHLTFETNSKDINLNDLKVKSHKVLKIKIEEDKNL